MAQIDQKNTYTYMKTIKLKLTKAQIKMLGSVLSQFDLHIEDSQDNYNALTKREERSYDILVEKIYRQLTK